MTNPKKCFSRLVSESLDASGLSQNEFAKKVGVTGKTISDWMGEDGVSSVSPKNVKVGHILRLAELRKESVDEMLIEIGLLKSKIEPEPKDPRPQWTFSQIPDVLEKISQQLRSSLNPHLLPNLKGEQTEVESMSQLSTLLKSVGLSSIKECSAFFQEHESLLQGLVEGTVRLDSGDSAMASLRLALSLMGYEYTIDDLLRMQKSDELESPSQDLHSNGAASC